jgi:hypothetical protein
MTERSGVQRSTGLDEMVSAKAHDDFTNLPHCTTPLAPSGEVSCYSVLFLSTLSLLHHRRKLMRAPRTQHPHYHDKYELQKGFRQCQNQLTPSHHRSQNLQHSLKDCHPRQNLDFLSHFKDSRPSNSSYTTSSLDHDDLVSTETACCFNLGRFHIKVTEDLFS